MRGHLQTGLTSEEKLGMNEGSAIPQAGAHMGQNGNRESPLVQRPRFSASWPPKYPCSALLSPFSHDGLKPQNLNLKGDLSFLVFPGILLQRQERLASNYHPSTDSTELEVPAPPHTSRANTPCHTVLFFVVSSQLKTTLQGTGVCDSHTFLCLQHISGTTGQKTGRNHMLSTVGSEASSGAATSHQQSLNAGEDFVRSPSFTPGIQDG